MKIKKKAIKRILIITLTNIGDIVLTTPVISALDREFPKARIDVMSGPAGKGIFKDHPRVFKTIIYNKRVPIKEKRRLVRKLKKTKYDLVVDLKNTLFPLLIGSRYRTSPIQAPPKEVMHKKDFHLCKLSFLGIEVKEAPYFLHVSREDRDYSRRLMKRVPEGKAVITISPTAKSLIKRWGRGSFARLSERLVRELGASLVMVGDAADKEVVDDIIERIDVSPKPVNFAGLTNIPQLAHVIASSNLLICNDSAPMHVGSAMGTKVLAIFGPSDHRKYGPRGKGGVVVRKELKCSPCEEALCRHKHQCMRLISADEVFEAAKGMLT